MQFPAISFDFSEKLRPPNTGTYSSKRKSAEISEKLPMALVCAIKRVPLRHVRQKPAAILGD